MDASLESRRNAQSSTSWEIFDIASLFELLDLSISLLLKLLLIDELSRLF